MGNVILCELYNGRRFKPEDKRATKFRLTRNLSLIRGIAFQSIYPVGINVRSIIEI